MQEPCYETVVRMQHGRKTPGLCRVQVPTMPRQSVSCLWTVLELNRTVYQVQILTAAWFHRTVVNTTTQTAGDINISNYLILDSFKLHASRIGLFATHTHSLNPLSVVNPTPTRNQLRSWMHFPTWNTSKTLLARSFNHCHLPCRGWNYTPAPALC